MMSFGTQGATPLAIGPGASLVPKINLGSGSTPAARALSNTASAPQIGPSSLASLQSAGLTKPATPLKSVTHNNVDGSSSTATYHAPPEPTSGLINQSLTPKQPASDPTSTNLPAQTTVTPSPPPPPPPYQAPTGSGVFGQAVTDLANTSSQGSPTTAGLIGATGGAAQGAYNSGSGLLNSSTQDANALKAQLQSSMENENKDLNTNRLNPIPIGDQTGRDAAIRSNYEQQQAKLAGTLNYDLGLANTGVAGQGQGISGLNSATGQANTAQGLTQSGLGTAAGLAQPATAAYGQTVFDPTTGTYNNGGGLPDAVMSQYAQMAANGQYSAIPSSITSNPVLSAQLNTAAKQINPNFSPIVSTAQGSATASNVNTAGTAGVQANQSVFNKAYGDYTTLQNAVQNVDQFGSLLTQNMGGINPTDVKYANRTIAQIRGQLSSAQQAQFDSTLAALTSKVSGLLSVGGNEIPTDISSAANKIVDGSLPIGSLSSVLTRIQAEGNILLKNQADVVNKAYSGIQNSSPTNATPNASQPNPWH